MTAIMVGKDIEIELTVGSAAAAAHRHGHDDVALPYQMMSRSYCSIGNN